MLFNTTLLSSTVMQPEISVQETICPYLGDLHQFTRGGPHFFLSLAILIHVQCGLEALLHRQSLTNQCLSPSCLTERYPISLTRLPRGRQLISVFPQCPGRTGTQEHLLQNRSQQNPVRSTCSPTLPIAHLASPSPLLGDKTGQTLGCRGVGWEAERAQSEW